MSVSVAKLFVRLRMPYLAVPRGGKRVAARIARDFYELVAGFTQRYNELHATDLTVEQGLAQLLDSGLEPNALFSEYRVIAEQARGAMTPWTVEKGFSEAWRWLTPAFATWFVRVVLPRPYKIDDFHTFPGAPLLTQTLVMHPRGMAWIRSFVLSLRQFLFPDAPPFEEAMEADQ